MHYYDLQGRRMAFGEKLNYYCNLTESDREYMFDNGNKSKEFIDSLNSLVSKYKASVKWAISDGFIVTCDNNVSGKIYGLLNRELFLMTSESQFLEDQLKVIIKEGVSEIRINEILTELNVTQYFIKNETTVFIQLQNSPLDNNDNLTNKLIKFNEVKKIVQSTIKLYQTDN